MDDQRSPRRSQSADRETAAQATRTPDGTDERAAPSDRMDGKQIDVLQTARFTLELRSPDGQPVSKTSGNDAWRALHEFSGFAGQDLSKRLGVGTSAKLTDRGGVYGARLEVDDTGANQLKFDSDEGRSLYKQVYRERQLALSLAPMSNRIEAVAPEAEPSTSARKSSRTTEQDGSTSELRQSVLERLQERAEPEAADERQQRDRDRQIVSRASATQIELINAALNKDEPTQLRKVLDQVQRQVETEVGQQQSMAESRSSQQARPDADRSEDVTEQTKRRLQNDPPIRERFTVIDHTWRTDYWQRDRPDRLGFTETWLTLKTAEHSASVIMGMVDRSRERGWTKLHLDGSPEFKREAWILAAARGLETSGYTATLGDREAVKTEQQRLSQTLQDRSQRTPALERAVQRDSPRVQREAPPSERVAEPARKSHLNAAITKAMQDARVPPGLQARLREMITAEAQRRQTSAPQWRAQVYDPAAVPSRPAAGITARAATRGRQHER